MYTLKKILVNSFVYSIYKWYFRVALPAIQETWFDSYVYHLYQLIDRVIIQSRPVQFFINPKRMSDAWYNSSFYKGTTFYIRRLAFRIPRSHLKFHSIFVGFFLIGVLICPEALWHSYYVFPVFGALALLYISHNAIQRVGTIFIMVNYLLVLFALLLALAVPLPAFRTLSYLLLAIDFFFLVSFCIKTKEELNHVLLCVYVAFFAIASVGFVQQYGHFVQGGVYSTFKDNISFAEVLITIFPFAMIFPFTMKSTPRRLLYLAAVMVLSLTVIAATQSKAALIGFSIELLLIILLTDWRYLPLLLLLAPAITNTAIENIMTMWQKNATYGNIFENIFYVVKDFWSNGFGVSRNTFLDIYNSTALGAETGNAAAFNIPYLKISPVYFNILIDFGAVIMFGFLYYILRLAHSTFTSLFTATKEQRWIFAAGLAMLVGISISAMFESTLFAPRTLITYWGMLGLLRAARIIKLGILDT